MNTEPYKYYINQLNQFIMGTIEYTVASRRKLTSIFNAEDIVSVVEISSHFGKSLAICLKHGTDTDVFMGYGNWRINGPMIFISLDRFTHHIPNYMALPKEQYGNVVIVTKKAMVDGDCMGTFNKATITKKVTW